MNRKTDNQMDVDFYQLLMLDPHSIITTGKPNTNTLACFQFTYVNGNMVPDFKGGANMFLETDQPLTKVAKLIVLRDLAEKFKVKNTHPTTVDIYNKMYDKLLNMFSDDWEKYRQIIEFKLSEIKALDAEIAPQIIDSVIETFNVLVEERNQAKRGE